MPGQARRLQLEAEERQRLKKAADEKWAEEAARAMQQEQEARAPDVVGFCACFVPVLCLFFCLCELEFRCVLRSLHPSLAVAVAFLGT